MSTKVLTTFAAAGALAGAVLGESVAGERVAQSTEQILIKHNKDVGFCADRLDAAKKGGKIVVEECIGSSKSGNEPNLKLTPAKFINENSYTSGQIEDRKKADRYTFGAIGSIAGGVGGAAVYGSLNLFGMSRISRRYTRQRQDFGTVDSA